MKLLFFLLFAFAGCSSVDKKKTLGQELYCGDGDTKLLKVEDGYISSSKKKFKISNFRKLSITKFHSKFSFRPDEKILADVEITPESKLSKEDRIKISKARENTGLYFIAKASFQWRYKDKVEESVSYCLDYNL